MNLREPIAIVGMACRYPGAANSPAAFWRLLCEGRDCIREITPDRWSLRAIYDPEPSRIGKTYSRHAGLIDRIDQFDPQFFGISPREAQAMDPQQRLLLETAWEAMEDAGLLPEDLAGSSAGVFVGISTHDYGDLMSAVTERKVGNNPYLALGSALCIAANRISYCFNLKGPSFAVDTACSSSLVALHLACESIRRGESSLAFVGGSNAILKPEMTLGFSNASMLSPDGRCRSFDARANGYVRAEGAGMLVLKPLSAARRDGDRIYSLVLATAINQDGQTPGISVPDGEAQAALLRQACAGAGVRPGDVQYIEAHGTGTPVGDPIEARALGSVVGRDRPAGLPCLLGSVKSNIGHLEAGAGVAGVMKAALAIHHGLVPPNLHFETPNPQIDMDALGLRVPTRLEPWPPTAGGPRLAGVNSFGFGGTNAHALLAETPREPPAPHRNGTTAVDAAKVMVLPLSARSHDGLRDLARRYRDFLLGQDEGKRLADIVWTASVRRTHHAHRLAVVVESRKKLIERLETAAAGENASEVSWGRTPAGNRPGLVFVFTGMGPQWWGMGQQLLEEEPVFRAAIQRCDRAFGMYLRESILEEMSAPEERSRIRDERFAQMGIFSLQVGLAELWQSWGIRPDTIVGHSVGEVAAAYVAGALSFEDAVHVSFHRSRLQQRTRGQGKMLAVGLPLDEARRLLIPHRGKVSIAAVNGPQSITLAGHAGALAEIHDELTIEGTFARFLQVEIPYHSPSMDGLRGELLEVLASLRPQTPAIPLFSTATGALLDRPAMDAAYWWKNVREPVQFAGAIDQLQRTGHGLFLEIGPHPVLASSIQQCALASDKQVTVLPSLRRQEPERTTLLGALGRLYTAGWEIDWARQHPHGGHVVSLPTYPWQHERCWRESETSQGFRTGEVDWTSQGHFGKRTHSLLGQALVTAHAEPAWDNELDLARDHAWLADHRVQGAVVLPAAAHVEMALAAAQQQLGPDFATLASLELDRPLFLTNGHPQPVQLLIDRSGATFTLFGKPADGDWVRYSAGRFERSVQGASPQRIDPEQILSRCRQSIGKTACYEMFRSIGLDYGTAFAAIDELHTGQREAMSRIAVAEPMSGHLDEFVVLPTVLDAAFQTLLGTLVGARPRLYLPAWIGRIRVHRRLGAEAGASPGFLAHARLRHLDEAVLEGDITIADDRGNILVEVEALRCRALAGKSGEGELDPVDCFHREAWLLQAAPGDAPPDTPAWTLPQPRDLADAIRAAVVAPAEPADYLRHHRDAETLLAELSLAYFVEACRRLGWEFNSGVVETFDGLAARLRIAAQQRSVFHRLLHWLNALGLLQLTENGFRVEHMPEPGEAALLWRNCVDRFPAYLPRLVLLRSLGSSLAEVLRGEIEAAEPLSPAGSPTNLANLYRSDPAFRACNSIAQQVLTAIVSRIPAERPLRILEIGGGTGCLTEQCFADRPFLSAQTLDPVQDATSADFEAHSFDVIVVGHVGPTSPSKENRLELVKSLLAPGGLVLWMDEIADFALTVLGPLQRDTPAEGGEAPTKCAEHLRRSGFEDVQVLSDMPDDESPTRVLILAQGPVAVRASKISTTTRAPGQWLVLADRSGCGEQLAGALKESGARVVLAWQGKAFQRLETGRYQVRPDSAEDLERLLLEGLAGAPSWTGIAFLWGLDLPGIESLQSSALLQRQAELCASVAELTRLCGDAKTFDSPRLWIVTRAAQAVGDGSNSGLAQGVLWGVGRVLANEHSQLRCALVDLGPAASTDEIQALARELCETEPENEIALRGADRFVHRLLPLQLQHSQSAPASDAGPSDSRVVTPFRLEAGVSGLVDELRLRPHARQTPGAGQVEIEVHATPLNFKDVAKAMHLLGDASLEGTFSGSQLGLECAGRIVAIGEGVQGFATGDEVVCLAPGSFASHVIAEARAVAHKPAHLSFEEAATLPVVFLTVQYGLCHLARLRPGERVLIHSATGGVGLAAIQIARLIGAEVYATAGSPEKRQFLRSLGIQHVMDSRALDFADEVMAKTGGEGIDVVLNSLGGETLVRSLSLLRECGRFVELGKRDLEFNTRVGLRPFLKQLSFFAVDLDRLVASRPELCSQLFREVMQLVGDGRLHPLPHVVYPVGAVREAFGTLQKARHIGKIVVSMREAHVLIVPEFPASPSFRQDGTYLVTGGLGGFGLATARWLVDRGARHLLLVGRSGAASADAQTAVARLRDAGATVNVAQADVASESAVARVLAEARRTMPPMRGVFHAAMVLDDAPLLDLDRERFLRVLGPKVAGAWNLHVLTRSDPIEHFVLFSSCAALVGNPAQASYVAANHFLDLLAHHRRSQGLPALAVDWGVVRDVGVVATRKALALHLENIGLVPLPARDMLDAMGSLLDAAIVQSSVLRADWALIRKSFPALAQSPRLCLLRSRSIGKESEVGANDGETLQQILLGLAPDQRQSRVQSMVCDVVARVLGTSAAKLDTAEPMTRLGMDSLMAVELASRIKKELQLDVPTMTFMRGPSIAELSYSLLELMLPMQNAELPPAAEAPSRELSPQV